MSKHSEAVDNGIAYDVARFAINEEIGLHQAAIYAIENDKAGLQRHRDAIRCLIEARRRLHHDNREASEIVRLLLRGVYRGS